ncbi:universal stress protein [Albidovulum sediminicola]|uniref:Universal stress protein n=1 Tax=Albidovulum sediminicola TaxID=2984331 RepID=A0ABT2Z213_9RHOB|nr:universal stress protein [Defluviimonas sp. WL0075]MCV2865179.1 universal stress protein [Defluviimonas sp. WL0075]
MIEKLLVAVDGSGHSLKAVEYAAEIAAACNAKLLILTVLRPRQTPKVSEELRKYAQLEQIAGAEYEAIKLLSRELLSEAEDIARTKGATDIAKVVETGPVARTIVDVAKKNGVSIIVIGSRGLGNIEATLRGGVSHRVELLAKCPVLTVK